MGGLGTPKTTGQNEGIGICCRSKLGQSDEQYWGKCVDSNQVHRESESVLRRLCICFQLEIYELTIL